MIELIYDKEHRLLLPQSADELNGRQFISIAGALHSGTNVLKMSLRVLRALLGKSLIGFYLMDNDIKHRCLDHVQWVFGDLAITKQLIPKYRGFYGPKSELTNITLAEFYFTERFFAQYLEKQAPEALDSLISVLYRVPKAEYDKEKDLEGDIRQAFNSNASEYYARKVKKWPLRVKQAILMWYDSCRAQIAKDNPAIFNSAGSPGEETEADMFGILRGLAGGKYGDFEKVEKMYLGTALLEMNFIIAENERLQAEIEKQK